VEELLKDGILPNVAGLFDDGLAPQAILLSHSHLDHSGFLPYSKPQVPIYASKGTSKMMLAAAIFSKQKELDRARYREVASGQAFEVGDIRIIPYAVDHSAYGSLSFLVEAEGKSLLYSGDLRHHGRKPGMIKQLLREVAGRNIDVLLMEGTHLGCDSDREISEYELEEEIVEHVRSAPGLVLAAFSPLDVDRLVTYYRTAQRTGRLFVVDGYAAFVMHLVASETKIPRVGQHGLKRQGRNQSATMRLKAAFECLRGTHEIGGSCVEVATKTTRIVLDVGMPLVDAAREPFDQRALLGSMNGDSQLGFLFSA
jgi:ribonuclease J